MPRPLAPLLGVLLLAAAAPAQDLKDTLDKMKADAGKAAPVAGARLGLPDDVRIKRSPDAPFPAKPETLCPDGEYKPDDRACDEDVIASPRAGLTRGQVLHDKMPLSWGESTAGDGRLLAFLAPLDIPFELRQRVGVSIDYKEGSCPYKATLEHEKLHWDDNRTLYAAEVDALVGELAALNLPTKRFPKSFPPGKSGDRDAYEDKTAQALVDAIREHRARFKANALDAVRRRDTKDEYKRVHGKCPLSDWKTSEL